MGTYTGFQAAVILKPETPMGVIQALRYMVDQDEHKPQILLGHPLFTKTSWHKMLSTQSFYFREHERLQPEIAKRLVARDGYHSLSTFSSFKNYDGEIDAFIDWLQPHIEMGAPIQGFTVLTEDDYITTYIYANGYSVRIPQQKLSEREPTMNPFIPHVR